MRSLGFCVFPMPEASACCQAAAMPRPASQADSRLTWGHGVAIRELGVGDIGGCFYHPTLLATENKLALDTLPLPTTYAETKIPIRLYTPAENAASCLMAVELHVGTVGGVPGAFPSLCGKLGTSLSQAVSCVFLCHSHGPPQSL